MSCPVAEGVSWQCVMSVEAGEIEKGWVKGTMGPFKQNMTLKKPQLCDLNPPCYHISSRSSLFQPLLLWLLSFLHFFLSSLNPFTHRCVACHDRDDKLARVLLVKSELVSEGRGRSSGQCQGWAIDSSAVTRSGETLWFGPCWSRICFQCSYSVGEWKFMRKRWGKGGGRCVFIFFEFMSFFPKQLKQGIIKKGKNF